MAFLKDLGNKISTKSKEISDKARFMSEKSSLNSIIRREESSKELQFAKIGKIYYEKHTDDYDEEFAEAFEKIKEAQEKIQQTQEELTKLESRYNCPNCGAPFKRDSLFCAKCGAKLPEREEKTASSDIPEGAQKCPKCNNILKNDALFCNECGTKLEPQQDNNVEDKTEEELLTAPVYPSKEQTAEPEKNTNTDTEELVFTKKCPHCGNDMCEDDMFCNECGQKYE